MECLEEVKKKLEEDIGISEWEKEREQFFRERERES